MLNATQIVNEILNFVGHEPKQNWYVGVTDNCDRRLSEHQAMNTARKCLEATSSLEARRAEENLIGKGFGGGSGGGGSDSTIVYVYRQTAGTQR